MLLAHLDFRENSLLSSGVCVCVCVVPGGTPSESADELVWRDAESFGVFGRLQAKCP